MKLFRSMAVILILALATSPALAAICATSCASNSVMSAMHTADMAGMKNCHQDMDKQQHKSDKQHKSCAMGAGCHFSQATPIDSSARYSFAISHVTIFPSFTTYSKSVDLSPPLKPPA